MNKIVLTALSGAIPIVLAAGYAVLYYLPSTKPDALALLGENRPVEFATFVFLFLGGLIGLDLVRRLNAIPEHRAATVFYALFSMGLIVVAMEEIAWGQWLFGFETPDAIRDVNAQNELTLHNLEFMQGNNSVLRLVFGIGGLAGYIVARIPALKLAAPPLLLIPWFLVITVAALLEGALDLQVILDDHYGLMQYKLPEVIELLVGIVGFLYIAINRRRFLSNQRPAPG